MGKPIDHKISLHFILAGNSTVTFLNTKTQNRFTYRVVKQKKKDIDLYYVSVLTSPEIYTYIGSIFNKKFKHSQKSKIGGDSQSVKSFNYVLNNLQCEALPDFIEIWHEGKCGRCNRQLTVPLSIEFGFGPECVKLVFSKEEIRDFKLSQLLKSK